LLGSNRLLLASICKTPGGDEKNEQPTGTACSCVEEDNWKACDANPIPIIEAKTDLARPQGAGAGFVGDPQFSLIQQRTKRLASNVDLHPILLSVSEGAIGGGVHQISERFASSL